MSKLAKTETSTQHMWKVLNLTLFDIMELSDDDIVDANLFDKLYYHLLDNKKLRRELENE